MKRLALTLLLALPWLALFALIATAWWLIMFDGNASNDEVGWVRLAEAWVHRRSGGGILDRLLDWP